MIYLVQIGSYCHLNFISKLYTVTLQCFCITGFTLQGFQGYKICNFWTGRLFSMEITRFSKFEWILNLFDSWLATWLYLIGRYRFVWIRVSGCLI
jgi:hypothetical protein